MLTFGLARLVDNAYFYFAGYVVLQYIVLPILVIGLCSIVISLRALRAKKDKA